MGRECRLDGDRMAGGETGRNDIGAGIVRNRIGGDVGRYWIRDATGR